MKNWKDFNDECTRCGCSPVSVFTSAKQEGYVYDGDNVQCDECGLTGSVSVDEDDEGQGIAHVDWEEYED